MADLLNLDLSTAPDEQIKGLIENAHKELERRREICISEVQEQITELAKSLGMSPEQLVATMPRTRRGRAVPKSEPKYRNPDNPEQTWVGRGKRPNWLTSALDRGVTLEDMKI